MWGSCTLNHLTCEQRRQRLVRHRHLLTAPWGQRGQKGQSSDTTVPPLQLLTSVTIPTPTTPLTAAMTSCPVDVLDFWTDFLCSRGVSVLLFLHPPPLSLSVYLCLSHVGRRRSDGGGVARLSDVCDVRTSKGREGREWWWDQHFTDHV